MEKNGSPSYTQPMESINWPLTFALCLIVFTAGLGCCWVYYRLRIGTLQQLAETLLAKAELEAKAIQNKQDFALKHTELEKQREWEQIAQTQRRSLGKEEERLQEREDKLERRMNLVEKKLSDIEKREAILIARKQQLEEEKQAVTILQTQLTQQLERSAGLTAQEAKEQLLDRISAQVKTDAANYTRRMAHPSQRRSTTPRLLRHCHRHQQTRLNLHIRDNCHYRYTPSR